MYSSDDKLEVITKLRFNGSLITEKHQLQHIKKVELRLCLDPISYGVYLGRYIENLCNLKHGSKR